LNLAIQGRGSVAARGILRRIDASSQSLVETIARETFRSAGLQVESQRRFDRVGRVDLWVEGKVVVELDGQEFHSGQRDFVEDRRRWNELTLQQVWVLRFPAAAVLRSPERVLAQVQAMLNRLP
jgi:very-short-patch-repair endonuclease